MSEKYLILGSNSFIASGLIDYLLNNKCKVFGVSRSNEYNDIFLSYKKNKFFKKNFKFFRYDINKSSEKIIKLINKEKITIIFNFISQGMVEQSWLNPEDWYNTNVVSQVNLIEKIKNYKFIKKFIHFTTPEVYGSNNKWIKENYNFNPSTPYANSRACTDHHLRLLGDIYKFPIIFTRASNVFGSCQQLYRIIPKTIMCILNKKKIDLHGGGLSERSFIHVNDVSSALYKISKRGKIFETYHISTNQKISIKDLVVKICNLMHYDSNKLIKSTIDRVGKDKAYLLNSNKLRNDIKWKDEIDLNTGILEVVDWLLINYKYLNLLPSEYIHKK